MATDSFRRTLELVREGVIGEIREAHVWYVFGGSGPSSDPQEVLPCRMISIGTASWARPRSGRIIRTTLRDGVRGENTAQAALVVAAHIRSIWLSRD